MRCIRLFAVEFEKGEDPHLLTTGTWDTTTPASLVLSPNGEVLVIAHGSSISFYSTITGALDNTIEDIFLGNLSIFNSIGVISEISILINIKV